jgi:hypothetical protein
MVTSEVTQKRIEQEERAGRSRAGIKGAAMSATRQHRKVRWDKPVMPQPS